MSKIKAKFIGSGAIDSTKVDGSIALKSQLDAEQSRASAAEVNESSRALSAENSLSNRVDFVLENSDGAAIDSIKETVTAFQMADTSLQGAINGEASRAQAAETSLAQAVANEASRAQAAEGSLAQAVSSVSSGGVSDEASRAQAAESSLNTAVLNEASRAQAAESSLNTAVLNEASRAQAAESSLNTAVLNEASRAQAAESSISQSSLSKTLTSGNIFVGNESNVAAAVTPSGDVTISNTGATSVSAGAITNSKVNASAAIDFSKLASLTSGNILVGNASNVAASVTPSGDVTINNTGVTAIGTNKVTNSQLAQVATQTFKGRTSGSTGNVEDLTATQATALLNAVVGDSGSAGTKGLVPAPAAGDAAAGKFLKADGTWSVTSPLTTKGDVYVYGTANNRLPAGVNGQRLMADSNQSLGLRWKDEDGKNYILNNDAEVGTEGWSTYLDNSSVTFTASTDVVNLTAHGLVNGQTVSFPTLSTSNKLFTNILYYVISSTANTFKVSTTSGGSAVNITADSSGTMARPVPTDGTGGTAVTLWERSTSSPLRGTASFTWTKSADNRMGEGIGYAFTIDTASQSRVLSVSFDYKISSGTFADGDMSVWIYDVTNATLIQPAPSNILNVSGVGKWVGTFQAASNSTSYRLILHTSSISEYAYTLQADNFSIGEQVISNGAPVTDWTSSTNFTPTNFGTLSQTDYKTRRVGDTLEVQLTWKSGTTSASTASIALSGIAIDSAKMPTTRQVVGWANNVVTSGTASNLSGNSNYIAVFYDGSDTANLYLGYRGVSNLLEKAAANAISATSDTIVAKFSIPITGWSSSVTMSDVARVSPTVQTFTSGSGTYSTPAGVKYIRVRMVGGGGGGGGSGTASVGAGGNGGNTTFGTSLLAANGGSGANNVGAGATGGSASLGTGPIGIALTGGTGSCGNYLKGDTGYYSMPGSGAASAFGGASGTNSAFNDGLAGVTNTGGGGGGAWGPNVNGSTGGGGGGAGGFIDAIINAPLASYAYSVGAAGTGGTAGTSGKTGGAGGAGIIIVEEYYQSMGTIAASETVAARYYTAAGQSISHQTSTIVNFETKSFDTHGAVTTGASWKFTAPVSGIYRVSSFISSASTATSFGLWMIELFKNGVSTSAAIHAKDYTNTYITATTLTDLIKLVAGDYIDMRIYQNSGGSLSLYNDARFVYVSIEKIGN